MRVCERASERESESETENEMLHERGDFSNACLCNDFTMFSVMSESGESV